MISKNFLGRLSAKVQAGFQQICWRILQPEIALPSGVVAKVKSRSDWLVANEVFLNREYDSAILQAFRSHVIGRPIQILDLGANVGFFSLRCIELFRQMTPDSRLDLLVVEGASDVFADLQRRLAPWPSESVGLLLKGGLIGSRSGKAMFHSSLFGSYMNSVARDNKVSKIRFLDRYAEEREYLDLDKYVAPNVKIDLIKCDVEGSELDFLRNYPALLSRTRWLAIEFHPDQCDVPSCRELLRSYGFERQHVVKSESTHSLEVYRAHE